MLVTSFATKQQNRFQCEAYDLWPSDYNNNKKHLDTPQICMNLTKSCKNILISFMNDEIWPTKKKRFSASFLSAKSNEIQHLLVLLD